MKHSVTFIIAILILGGRHFTSAQEVAPFPAPPPNVSSVANMVTDDEQGDHLIISGTVYKSDGKTPYPDFILYFYQTDAGGVYNKEDRSWQRPRLRGWVKTDKNGRYEIHTIKPGSYPGSRNPAHIHVIVQLPGERPKWIEDFLFDGDPFIKQSDYSKYATKGSFSSIMKLVKTEDGVLHAVRDIKLSGK